MIGEDEFNNLFGGMNLWPDLIIEVVTAEGRFEDTGSKHLKVFLNIMLYLWSSCSSKCDKGCRSYLINDGADAAILRSEIVPPF